MTSNGFNLIWNYFLKFVCAYLEQICFFSNPKCITSNHAKVISPVNQDYIIFNQENNNDWWLSIHTIYCSLNVIGWISNKKSNTKRKKTRKTNNKTRSWIMRSDKVSTSWSTSDNRISLLVLKEKVSILWKKVQTVMVKKYTNINKITTYQLKSLNTKKTRKSLCWFGTYTIIMYEVHVIYYRISLNNEKSPLCVLAWLWGYGV